MTEKMVFQPSGKITDINDKSEIEYWGHEAGEFINEEEMEKLLEEVEKQKKT